MTWFSRRLCLVGVGLIGGSLARALKAAERVEQVVGYSRQQANLERALALGVIDQAETDPASAVRGADMVVLAVPLGAMGSCLAAIAPHLDEGAVLTDVGSAKGSVVDEVRRRCSDRLARFVPGHPIAGTEHSGVEASFATLFQRRKVILTPLLETVAEAMRSVSAMWEVTGAEVVTMGVEHHDRVLAETSHLPHMLAYTLVDSLARLDDRAEIFRYAAGGFRDFTRIASSDPTMWCDVCSANRDALLAAIDRFQGDLSQLRGAIANDERDTIKRIFERAKRARDNLYFDPQKEGVRL